MIIANNSEFIRTTYSATQNVTTPIKFMNTIELLGDTSSENSIISKKQAIELIDSKVQDLIANDKIEKLTKLTFDLNGLTKRSANGSIVTCHNGYGGCNLLFMDKRGYPLEIVGYSLGEKYNNVTVYNDIEANVMGNKQVYFALLKDANYVRYTYISDNPLRRCKCPLIDADKDYFADREMICMNVEYENNCLYTSNSDWLNPCSMFKGHSFAIPNSSNLNVGQLFTSGSSPNLVNGYIRFWIEDDEFDSLNRFIDNICGIIIGPCINVSNSLFGNLLFNLKITKNDYIVDQNFDIDFQTATKSGIFVNISKDENYDNMNWDSDMLKTYPTISPIGLMKWPISDRIKVAK